MKIITLGNGFISQHLPYPRNFSNLTIDDLRSELAGNLSDLLEIGCPDVLINCIGRNNANKTATARTNTILPVLIAEWCQKHDVRLINISSGDVFFGLSPNLKMDSSVQFNAWRGYLPFTDLGWKETDLANPVSYYDRTKYACDLLLEPLTNVMTLRIRAPISSKNLPRNYLSKLKSYVRVPDEPNSITSMDDLVRCIDWAAKNDLSGVYHVVNPQPITATMIMQEYQKYKPDHLFETDSLDKETGCVLNTDKLKQAGFEMTPTKEAVEKHVREYVANER